MSLFKKFKSIFSARGLPALGRKKPKKKPVLGPKEKVAAPKRGEPRPEVSGREKPVRRPIAREKDLREIYKILKEPHISEKSTVLAEENKYVFKVYPRANKIEVKKAVENLYGVRVKNINIINVHRKRRMLRGIKGFKTGYKKAITTLEKGEKIEIMPH